MEMNFMIPGLYEHFDSIVKLLKMMQKNPEWFYNEAQIGAVYGNFQFCIWDGGRIFTHFEHATRERVVNAKKTYNNVFHVPMRFVFTSTEIRPEHLHDRFCNMVMRECEDELNEIVVNSPILEEYIRENYPKYKIISSTTKCLSKPEDFKNEIANPNYHLVCLDYNLNKNWKMLETLNDEERRRCEFLINAICPPGCPSRKEHYRLNSLFYLNYGRPYKTRTCGIKYSNLYPWEVFEKNNLSPKECFEYAEKGFTNFKLEGRTFDTITWTANIVKYLVKDEYKLYVFDLLARRK